jgi:putative hydrolase of the HAD superfamily
LSSRFRLGVVTNTHYAPLIHTHLHEIGVAPYMKVVVTSVEYGRPKPHPGIFAAALAHLGCRAESTLFVGDSYEAGYLGAKGAGKQACLIDPAGATNVPPHEVIGSVLDVKTHVV